MTLVPDRFGLRPVYENAAGARADTPQALAGPRPTIDETALAGYLCFSHVPFPRSIVAGVHRVPPLPLPPPEPTGDPEPDPGPALRAAVRHRLPPASDEPVAVSLSGGLDSSLIAALLVEAGARVIAFTLDFGAAHEPETGWAEAVATHLKIPLHRVDASPARIAAALEPTARALPEPFGDGVTVPLWLLGQAAAAHARQLWNGEGGDQLFGGWANKPMITALAQGSADDEVTEYLHTYHRFHGLLERLYQPAALRRMGGVDAADWIRPALDRTAHPALLHRLRAANIALKGAQNIAPRCVWLARAHGLQAVAPFFDDALTAWTFSQPPNSLLDGATEKAALKRFAHTLLPEEIVDREKRGMGVPTAAWLLDGGPVARRARSTLGPWALWRESRFDRRFITGLWRGDDPAPGAFRRRRVGEKLWCLLFWELWRQAHGMA